MTQSNMTTKLNNREIKIPLNYKKKVEMEIMKKILSEVVENGSADRQWVITLLTKKIGRITGLNYPRTIYSIQEVLQDILFQIPGVGKNKTDELLNKIEHL